MNYTVFKVRLKNSNIQKGKSGGYRVMYYVKTADRIILATIYAKSDRADVDTEVIEDAIPVGIVSRIAKYETRCATNLPSSQPFSPRRRAFRHFRFPLPLERARVRALF
ncbi:hypothetical protein AB3R30_04285 [Leptolyngbyaceae cyanobacterium UHCC 1019]